MRWMRDEVNMILGTPLLLNVSNNESAKSKGEKRWMAIVFSSPSAVNSLVCPKMAPALSTKTSNFLKRSLNFSAIFLVPSSDIRLAMMISTRWLPVSWRISWQTASAFLSNKSLYNNSFPGPQ